MSTLENQSAFAEILKDPRALAEIELKPLKAREALNSMTHYDPRFVKWYEAYQKKEVEAQELSEKLSHHVDGSFAKLVQFRDSLAYHVEAEDLTLADILKVIAIRTP